MCVFILRQHHIIMKNGIFVKKVMGSLVFITTLLGLSACDGKGQAIQDRAENTEISTRKPSNETQQQIAEVKILTLKKNGKERV
ncbi:MAG: hypothetical protein ACI92E_003155 [Oceanicoccus sp.]|jgi:hypothetical protein